MKIITKALYLHILLFSLIYSQPSTSNSTSDSSNVTTVVWSDIKKSVNNEITFFKQPFSFQTNDWLKIGAVSVATGISFFGDKSIRNVVMKNHTQTQNVLAKYGDYYGRGLFSLGLGGALYFGGLASSNNEVKETGSILLEALVASGVTVTVFKFIFGRARPYKEEGEYSFNYFEIKNSFNSLPSGHTIVAFTTSAVLAERIDNIYASIGLYSIAALAAYQRIYSDNHWFSDTFLGAVMGITIGKYFVNLSERNNAETISKIDYQLFPYFSNKYNGLGISVKF